MGLEVRRVDHDALGLRACASQPSEDSVKHAETTPTSIVMVQRLVRSVAGRRGDAAYNTLVIAASVHHATAGRIAISAPSGARSTEQSVGDSATLFVHSSTKTGRRVEERRDRTLGNP